MNGTMNKKELTKEYLIEELADINTRLEKYKEGFLSQKEKQQVKNLIDKITVRKLLPDFSIEVLIPGETHDQDITFSLKLTEFLEKIKSEIPAETKLLIKKSELRKRSIELLLSE